MMLFDPGKGISLEDKNHTSRRMNFFKICPDWAGNFRGFIFVQLSILQA
ncbi:MAG: hypothetical protein H8E20_09040 [Verrucomicrobia bacterium]|nr:hypothetical protein [Verrucomicrobiota bacterium]